MKREWAEILLQEEVLWMQKSRVDWLRYDDRNIKKFHTSTLVRWRKNKVEFLQDRDGNWIEDAEILKNLAVGYFSNLFSIEDLSASVFLKGAFALLEDGMKEEMVKALMIEETKRALWRTSPYKALGQMATRLFFFKRLWHLVGEEVHLFVKDILEGGVLRAELAQAMLVLIPKDPKPTSMRGFHPIILCNTLYKLVAKILEDRLKDVWSILISPYQTSFIPGRRSSDNVILCQEFIHSFRYTRAKKGAIMIKVDLEKAYDRLEWSLIEESLIDAGIPNNLTKVIMSLVTSSSCRLLWNGDIANEIKQSRGLRQGCPLSRYLFVLCAERLGQWLSKKAAEGRLQRVKASRHGPGLNYLFFAHDLLLFSEAREEQLLCIKEGLELFCNCSGQRVNFLKSSMVISSIIQSMEAKRLSTLMGIPVRNKIGKYLGHIIIQDGNNRERHKDILQWIQSRVDGWKLKSLSKAGRLTLAQSVLNSTPIFNMQLERLHNWVHKELDRVSRHCVWGTSKERRAIHLLSREVLSMPKCSGGANLKPAMNMNQVMLAKSAWMVICCPEDPWCVVLRSKYGVRKEDGAFLKMKTKSSSVWRGVVWSWNCCVMA